MTAENLAVACKEKLLQEDGQFIPLSDEYYYESLPLCVIDAVWSIGVRYTLVKAVVGRVADALGWNRYRSYGSAPSASGHTISEFLAATKGRTDEDLARNFYKSLNLTATGGERNLKAKAVREVCEALLLSGIDSFQDVTPENMTKARDRVLSVKGQGSGIAFDYLEMLAGSDIHVKADRRLMDFIQGELGAARPTPPTVRNMVTDAAAILAADHDGMSPRRLDYAIWNYEMSTYPKGRFSRRAIEV